MYVEIWVYSIRMHICFGSVRENLTLGSPLATDQELLNVLKLTGALNFVLDKKEGLDHQILEGGVGFSGGQRQAFTFITIITSSTKYSIA